MRKSEEFKTICELYEKDLMYHRGISITVNSRTLYDKQVKITQNFITNCKKKKLSKTERKCLDSLEMSLLFYSMDVNNHFGTYEKATIF